ncbi:ATP-binding cassette domain-containing protein [Dyella sp. LX-66]|uniref:ABC transporter ATP-binding protein n=1 Tax=unclassified Dyella TaxID=2634549 RepID=UPI001BE121EF|nr:MULTISPECIES: ATP-binding cassette domain-containing protein [unclassified Dyella]MBT2115863.1 ATP-binding cassette domain-containing protein [Dyella sp. LX-1]MBT2139678.1 ATP-binding cassette domain-containing protein [Dyella sp. LX-66]
MAHESTAHEFSALEHATPAIAADAPVLELDRASVLRGERLILEALSLRVAAGEHTAILGANGSGKSTLVKLVTRQLYPLARDDGQPSVRVFGRERWHVAELRSLLGIVSPALQLDYTTDTPLEVFDAVVSGFYAARGLGPDHRPTPAMRERAHEALAQMGIAHLIGRDMATLSTGEARRVLIARALVHRPRALLLDEPSAGLDLATRRHFLESLRTLARGGTTLLLVTHHIEEIVPEIGRVLLLREGKALRHGDKAQVLTDDALSDAFGMRVRVGRDGDYYSAVPA